MFKDNRGTLFFPIKNNNFSSKECTVSINKKNVFRGIHINNFNKYITCIQGKILDIIVDFNEDSPNYLMPKYYTLDPTTDIFQLLIPSNFGHSFLSLEENSILIYHFDEIFGDSETKHIHYTDPLINMILPIKNPILSDKDSIKNFVKPIDYIVFGPRGFIGSNVVKYLQIEKKSYITSNLRLQELSEICKLLDFYKPKYVLNCAGLTGSPNIFWCEDHKIETVENNITYQLTLAAICKDRNIHLVLFGSGGIFKNDKFYGEHEEGNFNENFYGLCRINLESVIKNYNNVLYLRINYPICNSKSDKNLLTKLISYSCIRSEDISITYLDDLIPILFKMTECHEFGICNFVSPGSINIIDIMNIYSNNTEHKFNVMSTENNKLVRSQSKLKTDKINKYFPLHISDAIILCIKNYIEFNKNQSNFES